jgi:hypothetical protein
MKNTFVKFLPLLALALATLGSCEDLVLQDNESDGLNSASLLSSCGSFGYADSVYYYKEQSTPYVVSPLTARAGTYSAYPDGLSINPATGAINVNLSESGLKYRVSFLATGSTDTCKTTVIISGVNYLSAVYNLSTTNILAKPYYNAQRNLAPPCNDDDEEEEEEEEEEDDDGCEFDDGDDDDDGDGTGDEPPSGQQIRPLGVEIDTENGIIDLQKTVSNGTFGSTPVSGSSQTFRIYYRIDDASNKALNYTDVKIHYYNTLADVPASLLNEINEKNGATLRKRQVDNGRSMAATVRPPHIVIVGRESSL